MNCWRSNPFIKSPYRSVNCFLFSFISYQNFLLQIYKKHHSPQKNQIQILGWIYTICINNLPHLLLLSKPTFLLYNNYMQRCRLIASPCFLTASLNPPIHIIKIPFLEYTGASCSSTIRGNSFCPISI